MKPRVAFVVAVSRNGIIGRAGTLPWRISSDLKHFKQITMGKPVIMGRKTWESLPRKPLPGRRNIVVTRRANYIAQGAEIVDSPDAALTLAAESGGDEISVIGGGDIFAALLPSADRLYLTEVDLDIEGDTYFPPIDPMQWKEASRETHARAPGDDAGFILRVLDRAGPTTQN